MKSSLEIPFSLEQVRAEMLDSAESWFRPLLVEARAESRILEAELGLQDPSSQGVMRLTLKVPVWRRKDLALLPRLGG